VAALEGREVVFDGERRAYDLFIGVPPHRAPRVVKEGGLTTGEWIRPDPGTCATAWPRVFAVGDVTEMPLANGMVLPKAGVFAEAQGIVAAEHLADTLAGRTAEQAFDGRGFCFIETGGGIATAVQGQFFAEPAPIVDVAAPNAGTLDEKRTFEAARLAAWF
jgi:sulfide:quinone oxidoreductase